MMPQNRRDSTELSWVPSIQGRQVVSRWDLGPPIVPLISLLVLVVIFRVLWGPKWETLKKEGLALRFRAKMAPSGRDEGVD